jgi:hypothetical protein
MCVCGCVESFIKHKSSQHKTVCVGEKGCWWGGDLNLGKMDNAACVGGRGAETFWQGTSKDQESVCIQTFPNQTNITMICVLFPQPYSPQIYYVLICSSQVPCGFVHTPCPPVLSCR